MGWEHALRELQGLECEAGTNNDEGVTTPRPKDGGEEAVPRT